MQKKHIEKSPGKSQKGGYSHFKSENITFENSLPVKKCMMFLLKGFQNTIKNV